MLYGMVWPYFQKRIRQVIFSLCVVNIFVFLLLQILGLFKENQPSGGGIAVNHNWLVGVYFGLMP